MINLNNPKQVLILEKMDKVDSDLHNLLNKQAEVLKKELKKEDLGQGLV